MLTPVATAKENLSDEAARALDDAASLAKRRNDAQTTSAHVVSALLSPSFSLLREVLTRCRTDAPTRLHLRTLELCVAFALDRQHSSRSAAAAAAASRNDDSPPPPVPPISNALWAAIKRAQANQRRQPEMYHLNQIHFSSNPISISSLKVELKHLVLAILDDPFISRVFGDAGFRNKDIKAAITNPPPSSITGWASTCRPRSFHGETMDDHRAQGVGCSNGALDENCRRIGELMVKDKVRNPILLGVCAMDALSSFKNCLIKGKYSGLPLNMYGAKLVCLEREIAGFLRREKEGLDVKLKEVALMVKRLDFGPGVVVNLGELKVLGKHEDEDEVVNELVLKLNGLVRVYGKKLWLIGVAADCETYSKLVGKFPTIERDWDLHPLPITSYRSSFHDALGSKSSFTGSFVRFGGSYPSQTNFRTPLPGVKQPFTHKQGPHSMLREGSSASIADKYSESLPSCLYISDPFLAKKATQVNDVKAVSPQVRYNGDFQCLSDKGPKSSSSEGSSSDKRLSQNASASSQQQIVTSGFSKKGKEPSECHRCERESSAYLAYSGCNLPLPIDNKPAPTVPVTTDLGLGENYGIKDEKLQMKPSFHGKVFPFQNSPSDIPSNGCIFDEKKSEKIARSLDSGDYKLLFRKLIEVVAWQGEAVSKVSELVSSHRSGNGSQHFSNLRGNNLWLSFHGPDRIGKRRVAETLADVLFGSRDCLITVNLSSRDFSSKAESLIFGLRSHEYDINLGKPAADYIAQELRKKPHSIVFLENVDEADAMIQNSLSYAIQTGKFREKCGREVSINNVIFIATSSMENEDDKSLSPRKDFIKFPEERVLGAKNWQIQVKISNLSERAGSKSSFTRVSLVSAKSLKRKASEISNFDLNLPLEETIEIDSEEDEDSFSNRRKAWVEDFFRLSNGNVIFKPFNFDALADKLLRKVRNKFEETFIGERISMEIDENIMLQILAAVWCSEKKEAVENWIEFVLGKAFAEARDQVWVTDEFVVRLVSCESFTVNELASGSYLPKHINVSI